jgi:hypothetical protein
MVKQECLGGKGYWADTKQMKKSRPMGGNYFSNEMGKLDGGL